MHTRHMLTLLDRTGWLSLCCLVSGVVTSPVAAMHTRGHASRTLRQSTRAPQALRLQLTTASFTPLYNVKPFGSRAGNLLAGLLLG